MQSLLFLNFGNDDSDNMIDKAIIFCFGDVLHGSLGGVTSHSNFQWNIQLQAEFDEHHNDPRLHIDSGF